MNLFVNGKLNPQVFEMNVRQATRDLSALLLHATETQSATIESTHFLIALAKVTGGAMQKTLPRLSLNAEQWTTGLMSCASTSTGSLPPAHLTESSLHDSARALLQSAEGICARYN